MSMVSLGPRCSGCGTAKTYCMNRGVYLCELCPSKPKEEMVEESAVPPPPSRPRVEIPLEQLEDGLRKLDEVRGSVSFYDCKSCGAQVEAPDSQKVGECLFCGRKTVLSSKKAVLHPNQVVVPFRVGLEEAVEQMRAYLDDLQLRPTGIASKITVDSVRQVYLPFWCYDVSVQTEWKGSGPVWEEPSFLGKLFGKEGRYRVVGVSGFRSAEYDDWLVCASKGLSQRIVRQLEPFDTEGADLRREGDGADGVSQEVSHLSPRNGWTRAQVEIRAHEYDESHQEGALQLSGGGGGLSTLNGTVAFGDPMAKGALLPLYIYRCRTPYGRCTLAVNGETGACGGIVPFSYLKLIPVVLAGIAAFGLLGLVTGGLVVPALLGYVGYKIATRNQTVEQRAKRFPARFRPREGPKRLN